MICECKKFMLTLQILLSIYYLPPMPYLERKKEMGHLTYHYLYSQPWQILCVLLELTVLQLWD